MKQGRFKNKVVLVTGAASGIGRATAVAFGREGAKVMVNYHSNRGEAHQTVKLVEKVGGEALALYADVSKQEEVKKMMKEVKKECGGIDVLVNNAGVLLQSDSLEFDEEVWRRIFEVNVFGVLLCSEVVVPLMKNRRGAAIVNVGSLAAIMPAGRHPAYNASKAAVHTLTMMLARMLGPAIRVNAVAPSHTETHLVKITAQKRKEIIHVTPLHRVGQPEDVADTILFLASDAARHITGQIVVVDGGESAAARA